MTRGGYMGRILSVDLASGQMRDDQVGGETMHDYIGGYGLGARLLYEQIPPGADPLGPENVLGFLTGPLTGTPALIGSRYVVVGKSPKTGGWGDANSGGYFGPTLKFAGYDGVLVRGVAPEPVYLLIEDGKARLCAAEELWGTKVAALERQLRARHGQNVRICSVGPSGEAASLLSCIINDGGRAAGRSGLGAVMGAKRLKAIVVRGKQKVPLADEARLKALRRHYLRGARDESCYRIFSEYGTCATTVGNAYSGDSPVRNWGGVGTRDFGSAAERLDGDRVLAYQRKKFACWGCPMGCGGIVELRQGEFALARENEYQGHKPEYETLGAFGTLLLNDDVESIIRANEICNDYGLDTISVGGVVGFAIECCENGVLSHHDVDGLDLRWGNAEAIVALTTKIARREGVGDLLADGIAAATARIGTGAVPFALEVGGEELPMHDPKFTPGIATTYILDATPGRHTQGTCMAPPYKLDLPDPDKYTYAGKADRTRKLINLSHVMNAAGLCWFGYLTYPVESLPEQLSAATGWAYTLENLYPVGERIATIRHLFNLREGLNPLLRRVPERMVGQPPQEDGPLAGITVDYRTQIAEYLEAVGWDAGTTVPGADALRVLGLDEMVAQVAGFTVPVADGYDPASRDAASVAVEGHGSVGKEGERG
jgi:aldehyde:ferredoxin oxidoreductase